MIWWALALPAAIVGAPFVFFHLQAIHDRKTIMTVSAAAQAYVDQITAATTAGQKVLDDLNAAKSAVETAAADATAQATEDLAAIGQAVSGLVAVFPAPPALVETTGA